MTLSVFIAVATMKNIHGKSLKHNTLLKNKTKQNIFEYALIDEKYVLWWSHTRPYLIRDLMRNS